MNALMVCLMLASGPKDTLQKDWYFRAAPIQMYTSSGNINDRISYNAELGISLNMLDIGICYGKTYNRPDTANYLEPRFTMDAAQYGIFSNEFAIGMGYIFKAKTNMIFEASYTINAQIMNKVGIGISVCYYDFTGAYYNTSQVAYGIFVRYGSGRTEEGTLTSYRTKNKRKIW